MHRGIRTALELVVCIAGLTIPLIAQAAGSMCVVETSGVSFGAYDVLARQSRDSSGTITVTCSGPPGTLVSYSLSLTGFSAGFSDRSLSSSSSQLHYNLYVDSTRAQPFGDGTNGTVTINGSMLLSATPVSRVHTVYGRMEGGQSKANAGSYSDQVVLTLTY